MNSPSETFYRRFTLPEERKSSGGVELVRRLRWFVSPNVVKLEDHRSLGEMGHILERLRQHERDQAMVAVSNILAKAKSRSVNPSRNGETT